MRCKPGDLAVVLTWKTGAIVEILDVKRPICPDCGDVEWRVRYNEYDNYGACDRYLRPIRPSDGADETLAWKDVPKVLDKPKERV